MQSMLCLILGVNFKKNDRATTKFGFVQRVSTSAEDSPLNWADVHINARNTPSQGFNEDGEFGASRVFLDKIPTIPYYSMAEAVADLTRKTEALERLLARCSPELAAEYAAEFPKGVPPTRHPMVPLQGDGNTNFANVSDHHWKKFGANAREEVEQIKERDADRYRKLTGRDPQDVEVEEEEGTTPKPKPTKKKKNNKKKTQKKRKEPESEVQEEEQPEPEPMPAIPRKLPRGGRLNRELMELYRDQMESDFFTAKNGGSGKKPRPATDSEQRDSNDQEEEEEESSMAVNLGEDVHLGLQENTAKDNDCDDDGDVQPMVCEDLPDVVVPRDPDCHHSSSSQHPDTDVEEDEEEDDDLELPLGDDEDPNLNLCDEDFGVMTATDLFAYDHVTGVLKYNGGSMDLTTKPTLAEEQLLSGVKPMALDVGNFEDIVFDDNLFAF